MVDWPIFWLAASDSKSSDVGREDADNQKLVYPSRTFLKMLYKNGNLNSLFFNNKWLVVTSVKQLYVID